MTTTTTSSTTASPASLQSLKTEQVSNNQGEVTRVLESIDLLLSYVFEVDALQGRYRLAGREVTASVSGTEGPGFESRGIFLVESYQ